MANKMASLVQVDIDRLSVTKTSWGQQFREAMSVNGGDLETAKIIHYFGHTLAFFWKVSPSRCEAQRWISLVLDSLRLCSTYVDRWRLVDLLRVALLHCHSHGYRGRRRCHLRLPGWLEG